MASITGIEQQALVVKMEEEPRIPRPTYNFEEQLK